MKKEQAAYNAKMDSKIHSQLDAWITLREHMSNLSLQLKEIGEQAILFRGPPFFSNPPPKVLFNAAKKRS